jgi:3-oxoacyl-[acyl-carrier-protein] synthase-3
MNEVYITRSATFLPNEPISNSEIERFMGLVQGKNSKSKAVVLRNNGIKTRYYALDDKGISTHNNAELTALAVKQLFDDDFSSDQLEMLSCGTSTPDHFFPSHAVMVHGLLKNRLMEVASSSGVCCSGMSALKMAFLNVKSGLTQNAVSTGSERVSTWLKSDKFDAEMATFMDLEEQPSLAFNKDFLRWMLSDGAGAFLLENKPRGEVSLKIEWMEFYSFAHELESCMYAGAIKYEDGTLKSWSESSPAEWLSDSVFSIKQDVKLLDDHIMKRGASSLRMSLDKHGLQAEQVDYFLAHMSSY